MSLLDREVLALRHFEQLTNSETAHLLGITESGASNRFIRALQRLRSILVDVPGFGDVGDKGGPGKVKAKRQHNS